MYSKLCTMQLYLFLRLDFILFCHTVSRVRSTCCIYQPSASSLIPLCSVLLIHFYSFYAPLNAVRYGTPCKNVVRLPNLWNIVDILHWGIVLQSRLLSLKGFRAHLHAWSSLFIIACVSNWTRTSKMDRTKRRATILD